MPIIKALPEPKKISAFICLAGVLFGLAIAREGLRASTMRFFPFVEFINRTADAIQYNREITVCPENCARCQGMEKIKLQNFFH